MIPALRFAEIQVLRSILLLSVPYVGLDEITTYTELSVESALGIDIYLMKPGWNVVIALTDRIGGLHPYSLYEMVNYLDNYNVYFGMEALK